MRAVEQRLGRAERRRHVAPSPGIGNREDRRLGPPDRELLDDRARDRLAVRPRGELLDLGGEVADVVADRLDERTARVAVGRSAEAGELLADPLGKLLLRHVVSEDLAGLGDCLGERRVFLDPVADERENGRRRGSGEVRLELLDIRGLPGLHPVDHDKACLAAEEAEGIAGGDRVLRRRFSGVEVLGGLLTDPRPQPLQRDRDLRPVRPRQEVDRLQLALARHAAKHRRRRRPPLGRERRPREAR